MTSNSSHDIHVDFILFRFLIIILCILLPCVMSFTGCNSYLLHVCQIKSNHINFIQVQIKLIRIHIRLFITITTEAINQLPFAITFHDLGCPFKTFCFVILNFHFQKCRDPNPRLDPVGGSKLELGLLRRFQSKHSFHFIKFLFSKVSRPESPT